MCWTIQWENFIDECYSKVESQSWILINPFDKDKTNALMGKLETSSDQVKSVVGLIFDVDSGMTAEKTYDNPPIMSEATPSESDQLKPYCYNEQTD